MVILVGNPPDNALLHAIARLLSAINIAIYIIYNINRILQVVALLWVQQTLGAKVHQSNYVIDHVLSIDSGNYNKFAPCVKLSAIRYITIDLTDLHLQLSKCIAQANDMYCFSYSYD